MNMKKMIFVLGVVMIIPFNALAFDIYGWWKSTNSSVLVKITSDRIHSFPYRVEEKDDSVVKIYVKNSAHPCFIYKKDDDTILMKKPIGPKEEYRLVTRNINLSREEVRKLCKEN